MRRSGRTFRLLMQALLKASQGLNVLVFTFNHAEAKELFDKAERISHFNYSEINPSFNLIKFENNGNLTFASRNLILSEASKLKQKSDLILYDEGC